MATSAPSKSLPTGAPRPVAEFRPSPWGNRFLHYTPDSKVIQSQQEIVKEAKVEIKRELLSVSGKPLIAQLRLIDSIERLGVAYHFEEEIEDALRRIHGMSTDPSSDDLNLISLRFQLLRQHGFNVSSDAFKELITGSNGSLKEEISGDVQGMLSLYEACHVRGHGEDILDEALVFTKSQLKSIQDSLSHLQHHEHLCHALKKPLQKRLTRLECVHYMQVYEQDPSHNTTLLRLAKVDFNLLQSSHKEELSEMCKWWKQVDLVTSKIPSRDRIVESYFWASGVFFEPQHSIGRKLLTMACQLITAMDDLYDAFGTQEELEIFTKAVQRWDKSCLDELPEYMQRHYQVIILDAFEAMERYLAAIGRSHYVYYAREEMELACQSYLIEATWRERKHVPTFEEYMKNATVTIGSRWAIIITFLHMDTATQDVFEWIRKYPKPIEAICIQLRLLDDIVGRKFDQNRDHCSSGMDCYIKQYGVTEKQAREELYKKVEDSWKDINEAMISPTEVPMPLLKNILNFARSVETIYDYDNDEDGFTSVNKSMKENITSLYINPIPM